MEHPARIGKYEIEQYLGGGMSRVYRAHDPVLGRTVALKILSDEAAADEKAKARFLREARVASGSAHENIIAVYDFGEDQGRPFMVMEFLEGESLREAIKQNRTGDTARKLRIALQVARAIGHVHTKKVIHRDIKPENVHLDAVGHAKLMDFGIAKSEDAQSTSDGLTLGTPFYMSPEQVMGKEITPQADVYCFGVFMYELFAGTKPVPGTTIEQVFQNIVSATPDWEPLFESHAPPAVIELVQKCLAKQPEDRPQGFGVICGALEEILGPGAIRLEPLRQPTGPAAPVKTRAYAGVSRTLPAPLRTPAVLTAVAAAVTLVVVVILYLLISSRA